MCAVQHGAVSRDDKTQPLGGNQHLRQHYTDDGQRATNSHTRENGGNRCRQHYIQDALAKRRTHAAGRQE